MFLRKMLSTVNSRFTGAIQEFDFSVAEAKKQVVSFHLEGV
jgi:hypothetical protein